LPFSYHEFCSFCGLDAGPESLSDYPERGGFPEILTYDTGDLILVNGKKITVTPAWKREW